MPLFPLGYMRTIRKAAMNKITKEKLIEKLIERKGSTFVAFRALTEAQKSKAKDAEKVYKLSWVNGIFNFNYENSVNNQIEREGKEIEFTAKPRQWGRHVALGVIEHKGRYYLQVKVERALAKPRFFWRGRNVAKAMVAHLLRESSASNQPCDKEIVCRDYSIDNLISISMDGKRYRLVE